jgi:hypothetical protein
MSPRRLLTFATLGIAATVVLLSGCSAGRNAQTAQVFSPVNGRNVNVPASPGYYDPYVAVRGVTIVKNEAGEAVLVAKIINNTDQPEQLVSVTSGGSAATLPSGGVTIRPGQAVSFGVPDGPSATWATLDAPVGRWTDVTLSMTRSGDVKLRVLVELNRNDYSDTYFPPSDGTSAATS